MVNCQRCNKSGTRLKCKHCDKHFCSEQCFANPDHIQCLIVHSAERAPEEKPLEDDSSASSSPSPTHGGMSDKEGESRLVRTVAKVLDTSNSSPEGRHAGDGQSSTEYSLSVFIHHIRKPLLLITYFLICFLTWLLHRYYIELY